MDPLISRVASHPNIERLLAASVASVAPSPTGFHVTIRQGTETLERDVGAAILATGFEHFDPHRKHEYGYGRLADVLDFKDVERMLAEGKLRRPSNGAVPRRVAWLLCVGSRDIQVGNTWCCRMGCAVSIKQAIEVRERYPDVEAYVYYMDIRTPGLWEKLYWSSMSEHGVRFIRGRIGHITVAPDGQRLLATSEDTLLHRPMEEAFDLIVLATGMEPGPGTSEAARVFHVPQGPEGFLAPRSAESNPVDSGTPGIFLAGAATGPKAISESVTEGMGAALLAYRHVRA
jgi:heterodisulfide reductase subunit A